MNWLPPYLIPMSPVAPVTIGPATVASWLFWLVAGPTVVGWMVTYVLAIRQAALDRRVGLPVFMIAVDFAWEFSLTFVLQQTQTQRGIDFVWVIFDVVLLYQAFRYGRHDYPGFTPARFRWALAGVLVWSALIVLAGANEFHDLDGMYTGMIINVPLSAGFILMLRRRGSSVGQSMYIAVAKCLGTLSAGCTGLLLYPHRLLFFVLVPTMVALDITYIVLLYRMMRAEGRSPWALRAASVARRTRPEPRPVREPVIEPTG